MNKRSILKIFYALFTGINIIWGLFYEFTMYIIHYFKKGKAHKEKQFYEELNENSKLFWFVISAPILIILIFLFFPNSYKIIISITLIIYIVIPAIILLFNKDSVYSLNANYSQLKKTFLEFGMYIIIDIIWFGGMTIYLVAKGDFSSNEYVFLIIFLFTASAVLLIGCLILYYFLLKTNYKKLDNFSKFPDLLKHSGRSIQEIEENIKKIEKIAFEIKKKELYFNKNLIKEKLTKKYELLIKILKEQGRKSDVKNVRIKFKKSIDKLF